MATASMYQEPGKRDCSVCNELLNIPKLLPCGHHLCRPCLVTWITPTLTEALCPLCRCPIIQDHVVFTDAESIADSFPTDLFMEKEVEAERMLCRSHHCRVCEDVAATSLCIQCGDLLCSSCTKAHKKLSITRDHSVEDLDLLTAEKLAAERPSLCEAHPEERCKLYCPSHDTPICWLCASTKHRACSDLTELSEKVNEACKSLENLMDKLTVGEQEIDQTIALLDRHWEKTDQHMTTALAEIREMRCRLESAVEAWEQRLTAQTQSESDYIKAAVEEAKEHLMQRRGKLSTHKEVMQQGQEMRDREVVNNMAVAMQTRVKELDHTKPLPADTKVVSTLEVTLDKERLSGFEQELLSLGKVRVGPADNIGIVKPPTLRFHGNHGDLVYLSYSQQRATKQGQLNDGGIVFSCEALKQNFMYEVKILSDSLMRRKQRCRLKAVTVGAVSQTPDTILLPGKSTELKRAFVKKIRTIYSPMDTQNTRKELTVRTGDRVGVCLKSDHSLHLYIDGVEQAAVIASEVPQPCYAVFDLYGKAGEITALPVTKVMNKQNTSISSPQEELPGDLVFEDCVMSEDACDEEDPCGFGLFD